MSEEDLWKVELLSGSSHRLSKPPIIIADMTKADKPKKEKRAADAAADGPEKKIKKSKKEKKDLTEEQVNGVTNGIAEPAAAAEQHAAEPVSQQKKKKKRKSDASEASEAAPSEPPSTEKKKKKKAKAEQTAAVPIAEAPVEGTVVVTAEDEDIEDAQDDEVDHGLLASLLTAY